MGHQSAYDGPVPTAENFHLGNVRRMYARDELTVEELERAVERILHGDFKCYPAGESQRQRSRRWRPGDPKPFRGARLS